MFGIPVWWNGWDSWLGFLVGIPVWWNGWDSWLGFLVGIPGWDSWLVLFGQSKKARGVSVYCIIGLCDYAIVHADLYTIPTL